GTLSKQLHHGHRSDRRPYRSRFGHFTPRPQLRLHQLFSAPAPEAAVAVYVGRRVRTAAVRRSHDRRRDPPQYAPTDRGRAAACLRADRVRPGTATCQPRQRSDPRQNAYAFTLLHLWTARDGGDAGDWLAIACAAAVAA